MPGEVGDGEHLVAQRRHEQQVDAREKMRAISSATLRRSRSACTKSTAERKRASRKRFGHASGTCTFSVAAAARSASAPRTPPPLRRRGSGCSESYGQSGSVTSVGDHAQRLRSCRAPRGRRRSPGLSFIQAGSSRRAVPSTGAAASKSSMARHARRRRRRRGR